MKCKIMEKADATAIDYIAEIYKTAGRSDFFISATKNAIGELIRVEYDEENLTADQKTKITAYLTAKGLS